MRIEWFKFFLDVAKTGSLRTSANHLYITQPALGAAITSLEKELGYPLFVRTHSGMQLTEYARQTIPLVQNILDNLESCNEIKKQYLQSAKNDITGSLNIATVPTIGIGIMPVLVSNFAQKFPNIELVIMETNSTLGMNQVLDGKSDVGFLVVSDEKNSHTDYSTELLWQERLYAFMRKDNALAQKQSISLKTLRKCPLAILSYEQDDFSVSDALFRDYGGALKIVFRSNSHKLLQNYVLNTDCIGLTHFAHVIERESNQVMLPGTVYIPVNHCPTSKFVAFYHKNNPKAPLIRLFIDALQQTIQQHTAKNKQDSI